MKISKDEINHIIATLRDGVVIDKSGVVHEGGKPIYFVRSYLHGENGELLTKTTIAEHAYRTREFECLRVGFHRIGYKVNDPDYMVNRFFNDQEALQSILGDVVKLDWAEYLLNNPPAPDYEEGNLPPHNFNEAIEKWRFKIDVFNSQSTDEIHQ